MQQYEFCEIGTEYSGRTLTWQLVICTPSDQLRIPFHDIESRRDIDNDARRRKMAELGLAGWQLVAVSDHRFYFQRPIE